MNAPLWTTEICGRCNADQSALITLAQGQGRRWLESEALADKVQQILDRAMECPECKEVLREKNQEDIMEVTKSIRYRINVSTSVKGQKTYDCTVDAEGYQMSEVLEQSDILVAALDVRYPAPEVK